MTPLRAALTHLIDYAGLFPPAGLDMVPAVRNYARYAAGEHQWMLGRFLVPAVRLPEFQQAFAGVSGGRAWNISALGMPEDASVDTVELKAESPSRILDARKRLPEQVVAYFEIPIDRDPSEFVTALAEAGARAKIRTGGLTPEMFPASTDLARFLDCCARNGVPFKATAGLHHPVRNGLMYGFVNLCLAAAIVCLGADQAQAVDTLEEASPAAFHFDENCVRWHGNHLTAEQVRVARETFFISFGSCSFEEPLSDLAALGWL